MNQDNVKSVSKLIGELKGKCYGYKNVSGNKTYQILRNEGFIYYDEDKINKPRQDFIDKEYCEVRKIDVTDKQGNPKTAQTIFLTPNGQEELIKWLIDKGYIKMIK